ncbi:hypothetical protein OCGS_0720 [Oceaniovalibus guishaninsula JLT2003]|uniref:HEPN domain-containing protein n=1 Tax=Oceaniovalibus guishaninsula JLT2003 TaxID=1231392 RepID=K2I7N2_9RHOB|nr:hypothetical protein [Oceaniovalibus guishaninsula]EKE45025.1 hypothetical protein OCGS_0720 [Oceaniovalibus guishaninsula JLT2003]
MASSAAIFDLAEAYRASALLLLQGSARGRPLARFPARYCALHAIELYLNAWLRSCGHDPGDIRACLHNVARMFDLASETGLVLRKKTRADLRAMTGRRDYLLLRYDPEASVLPVHVNRLIATMEEVRTKVALRIGAFPDDLPKDGAPTCCPVARDPC